MGKVRKTNKDLFEFDRHSKTGAFTVPCKKNIDMFGIREYCKAKNIDCSDLTKKEIKRFEK